ncbi:MAG: hypothetical protein HY820_10020, partial [Acidobacteria bacterium]|nr:hypothetical protein [Acidobacteriota bacterium]
RISPNGGVSPRWRKDGKEILYLAADGGIVSVPTTGTDHNFEPGSAVTLFQSAMRGVQAGTHFAITQDARNMLLMGAAPSQQPLTVLVNWDRANP